MEGAKNPFAIRNGKIITIKDLTPDERGLDCKSQCPACGGDFIARMGEVLVHHFAHSKEACDEVVAYTTGLYKLIHQILNNGVPFYVPALIIEYSFSYKYVMTEQNVKDYVRIIQEKVYVEDNAIKIADGREITFDTIDFISDKRGVIEALE
jgi:hypothetical protein